MNSCLYGNGTSFVESLFEDFGRLTSTVASKSFNHYFLFFTAMHGKNTNPSVRRVQLCVFSIVCPSTRLQFAHAQCVSCGTERGGRGGQGGGDSSQQVCECFRSVSVGHLPACLPASPTLTPRFNSHLRHRRTRPRPSRPRPFLMTTTKRPFPWIPAPPLSTSPPT